MSDFGTIIIFRKKVGHFSDKDKEKLERILIENITTKDFPSNIVDGSFAFLVGWDKNAYCSIITEYFMDDTSEEIKEFALKDDLYECKKIIDKISNELSNDFYIEAKFEEW